jgi:hypothetical protein
VILRPGFDYAASAAQIFGGAAIHFRRDRENGRSRHRCSSSCFAVLCEPRIVAAPQIYDRWGNFFEQFSLATGAAIVHARLSSAWARETLHRTGHILSGIASIDESCAS